MNQNPQSISDGAEERINVGPQRGARNRPGCRPRHRPLSDLSEMDVSQFFCQLPGINGARAQQPRP